MFVICFSCYKYPPKCLMKRQTTCCLMQELVFLYQFPSRFLWSPPCSHNYKVTVCNLSLQLFSHIICSKVFCYRDGLKSTSDKCSGVFCYLNSPLGHLDLLMCSSRCSLFYQQQGAALYFPMKWRQHSTIKMTTIWVSGCIWCWSHLLLTKTIIHTLHCQAMMLQHI